MENVIQNLTEIDNYGDKKFKFSHLDKFGTMLRFHIQGSYAYQTKIGSIFTLLYYLLVMSAFFYYSLKFADTSQPLVVMSEYEEEEELSFNIIKGQHILYWAAIQYPPLKTQYLKSLARPPVKNSVSKTSFQISRSSRHSTEPNKSQPRLATSKNGHGLASNSNLAMRCPIPKISHLKSQLGLRMFIFA
jgi:hypothetical protein